MSSQQIYLWLYICFSSTIYTVGFLFLSILHQLFWETTEFLHDLIPCLYRSQFFLFPTVFLLNLYFHHACCAFRFYLLFVAGNIRICCNHSAGVALNARFTTNGMCVKNSTHIYCTWREQAIIEWLQHVSSILACCHSAKLCSHATRDFWSQQIQTVTSIAWVLKEL